MIGQMNRRERPWRTVSPGEFKCKVETPNTMEEGREAVLVLGRDRDATGPLASGSPWVAWPLGHSESHPLHEQWVRPVAGARGWILPSLRARAKRVSFPRRIQGACPDTPSYFPI